MTTYVFVTIFMVLTALFYNNCRCVGEFNIAFSEYGVNHETAQKILDLHNYYRTLVLNGSVEGQPRAVQMTKLQYNFKLGLAAQQITDSYGFHPIIGNIGDEKWKRVGLNTYTIQLLDDPDELNANWPKTIKAWFDEHRFYVYGSGLNSESLNYTQLVWADTEFVGCGYTKWKLSDLRTIDFNYTKYYACVYGPGGNVPGIAPYKTNITELTETDNPLSDENNKSNEKNVSKDGDESYEYDQQIYYEVL